MKRIVFREAEAPERDLQYFSEATQCFGVVDMFLSVFDILDIARKDSIIPVRFGPERS